MKCLIYFGMSSMKEGTSAQLSGRGELHGGARVTTLVTLRKCTLGYKREIKTLKFVLASTKGFKGGLAWIKPSKKDMAVTFSYSHQQIKAPGLLYQNTNPSLPFGGNRLFNAATRPFIFAQTQKKHKQQSHSSPCFSPSHSSSAVWYGGSSEQTSRKIPDAAATVFSRSSSFRRGIVAVKNKCVPVSI